MNMKIYFMQANFTKGKKSYLWATFLLTWKREYHYYLSYFSPLLSSAVEEKPPLHKDQLQIQALLLLKTWNTRSGHWPICLPIIVEGLTMPPTARNAINSRTPSPLLKLNGKTLCQRCKGKQRLPIQQQASSWITSWPQKKAWKMTSKELNLTLKKGEYWNTLPFLFI